MKAADDVVLKRAPIAAMRGFARVLLGLLLLLAGNTAIADDRTQHFNLDDDGYAIGRYDPVGYFSAGKAVRGRTALTAEHEGVKYAFSSDQNRKRFLADPEKYVPQYGGNCAFGLVHGSKSDIDPEIWEIVDGRLFFLINPGTKSIWSRMKQSNIRTADKAWESISGQK